MRRHRHLRFSGMTAFLLATLLLGFAHGGGQLAIKPLTVAESSSFTATSTYADVAEFIKVLQGLSPNIRVETLCTSTEGREVPLIVIGKPLPLSPEAMKSDGRIAVYIQANIHAGEVEGKEAALMLARDILLDPAAPYLDRIVLLIAPLFNADGNDKMDPANRPGQVGPEKGSGVRHNGQNLDLNRDAIKMESPELRGLVRNVLLRWDPILLIDCHTTNGSYHDEPVTYSWPLCRNGDQEIVRYMRDTMLPAVDAALEKKYGILSIPYGDPVDFRNMAMGWRTFSQQPRFMTNYIGLRNRLSILDENYNYADFKTRVFACLGFLRAILDYSYEKAGELARLCAEADSRTVERGLAPSEKDMFGLDMELKPLPQPVTILGYEVEVTPREGTWPEIRKTDRKRTFVAPYLADFVPRRSVRLPWAYLISVPDPAIREMLLRHGIALERLSGPAHLEVEAFEPTEIKGADRLYQGHRLNQVKGAYRLESRDFPEGTLLVRTAQPLGSLAAYLLEPESDDGLLVWNAFDRWLVPQWGRGFETYPVFKLYSPRNLATKTVR